MGGENNEVTEPIMLDSTGQDIVNAISSNIIKISTGTENLVDGVSPLPTGEIYMVLEE